MLYQLMSMSNAPINYRQLLKHKKYIGFVDTDGEYIQITKENNQVNYYNILHEPYAVKDIAKITDWINEYLPNETCLIGQIYFPANTDFPHIFLFDLISFGGVDYCNKDFSYRFSQLCLNIDLNPYKIDEIEVASCLDNTYIDLVSYIKKHKNNLIIEAEDAKYFSGQEIPEMFFKLTTEDVEKDIDN